MNFLSWIIALSVLIFLMVKVIAAHKASVCRQEAWLKSTEFLTRSFLSRKELSERQWHLSCGLKVTRKGHEIFWQKLPSLEVRKFPHSFEGSL